MKLTTTVACSLLFVLAAYDMASPADAPRPGQQSDAKLAREVPVNLDYLLFLPEDYADKDEWPLMLFLHGAGERGSDLELVKKHGPPKIVEADKSFPFVLVSPQCPSNRWWEPFSLTVLLDEIVANHKIDEDRIYVTGLSMGGFGTWSLAFQTPERFAALAPICGGGDPIWARRLQEVPIWIFHGGKDTVVPLERSTEMAEALEQRKGNVKLTVYPDANHDSWSATYANPGLYKWLLSQHRVKQP